ncbi:hypothetical protein HZS_1840 [Henneguya salminicola]|nr:hypothetical protein HZS_1840 [Henneguya salminicola]
MILDKKGISLVKGLKFYVFRLKNIILFRAVLKCLNQSAIIVSFFFPSLLPFFPSKYVTNPVSQCSCRAAVIEEKGLEDEKLSLLLILPMVPSCRQSKRVEYQEAPLKRDQ